MLRWNVETNRSSLHLLAIGKQTDRIKGKITKNPLDSNVKFSTNF